LELEEAEGAKPGLPDEQRRGTARPLEGVMTDRAWRYTSSRAFRNAMARIGAVHKTTSQDPYRAKGPSADAALISNVAEKDS
jgi:hypothetical protein